MLEAAALFFFGRGEEATRARREKARMELENCILKVDLIVLKVEKRSVRFVVEKGVEKIVVVKKSIDNRIFVWMNRSTVERM